MILDVIENSMKYVKIKSTIVLFWYARRLCFDSEWLQTDALGNLKVIVPLRNFQVIFTAAPNQDKILATLDWD